MAMNDLPSFKRTFKTDGTGGFALTVFTGRPLDRFISGEKTEM